MAGRLAQVLQQEYKTKGVLSGFASGVGKTALEKIDLRNAFFSGAGFGSVIGRKVFGKGYSATRKGTSPTTDTLGSSDGVLNEIRDNSIVSTKNSMSLPLIASQINIMQKNVAKLVKLQGGSPSQKADAFFSSAKFRENAYEQALREGKKSPTQVTTTEKSSSGGLLTSLALVGGALLLFGNQLGTAGKIIGGLLIGLVALKTILTAISAIAVGKGLIGLGSKTGKSVGGKKGIGRLGLALGAISGGLLGYQLSKDEEGLIDSETGEPINQRMTGMEGAALGAAGVGVIAAKSLLQPKLDARIQAKAGGQLGFNEKAGRFTQSKKFVSAKDLPLSKTLENLRNYYIKISKNPGLKSFILKKLTARFGITATLRVGTFLTGLAAAPFTAGLSTVISLASWGLTAYTIYEVYDWLFGEENNAENLEKAFELEQTKADAGKSVKRDLSPTAAPLSTAEAEGIVPPSENVPTPETTSMPRSSSSPVRSAATSVTSGGQIIGSEEAINYLMQKGGFTREQAAGIVGNLMQESSLNSGAENKSEGAFGLAQWRKDRLENLKSFASKQGKNINDPYTQLDFLMHELGTSERKANEALRQAKSAEEAALVFGKLYERPRVVEQSRLDYASAAARGSRLESSSIAVADAQRATAAPSAGNIVNSITNNNVAQGGAVGKPASTYDAELTRTLLSLVTT